MLVSMGSLYKSKGTSMESDSLMSVFMLLEGGEQKDHQGKRKNIISNLKDDPSIFYILIYSNLVVGRWEFFLSEFYLIDFFVLGWSDLTFCSFVSAS